MEVPVVVMTEIAHDAFGGPVAVSVALFPLVTGEVSEVIFTESSGVGVRRGVASLEGVSVGRGGRGDDWVTVEVGGATDGSGSSCVNIGSTVAVGVGVGV